MLCNMTATVAYYCCACFFFPYGILSSNYFFPFSILSSNYFFPYSILSSNSFFPCGIPSSNSFFFTVFSPPVTFSFQYSLLQFLFLTVFSPPIEPWESNFRVRSQRLHATCQSSIKKYPPPTCRARRTSKRRSKISRIFLELRNRMTKTIEKSNKLCRSEANFCLQTKMPNTLFYCSLDYYCFKLFCVASVNNSYLRFFTFRKLSDISYLVRVTLSAIAFLPIRWQALQMWLFLVVLIVPIWPAQNDFFPCFQRNLFSKFTEIHQTCWRRMSSEKNGNCELSGLCVLINVEMGAKARVYPKRCLHIFWCVFFLDSTSSYFTAGFLKATATDLVQTSNCNTSFANNSLLKMFFISLCDGRKMASDIQNWPPIDNALE